MPSCRRSRDGKELYFLSPDGKMMAAEVKSGPKFETAVPKPLFDVASLAKPPGKTSAGTAASFNFQKRWTRKEVTSVSAVIQALPAT